MRKIAAEVGKLAVWLGLMAALAGVLQGAEIDAPERVDPHQLVVVKSKTPGKSAVAFVVGPRGFERTYKCNQEFLFTGPPGQYMVLLVVSLEDGSLDQGQAVVTIGDAPPPTPPTPPTPPVPPPSPIPDDVFGNVGQKSHAWGKELKLKSEIARAISADYSEIAKGLEDGTVLTITDANTELRKRRDEVLTEQAERDKWNAWGGRVNEVWNAHQVGASREKVVLFYRAVAAGLGAL